MSIKKVLVSTLVITLLAGASVFILEKASITNLFGDKHHSEESPEETKVNADKKEATINSDARDENKGDETRKGDSYTPPTNPDSIVLSAEQNNREVIVSTKLYGYSDGTCKLTASNKGKQQVFEAPIIFQREFSTCAGFNIPVNLLGTGSWKITLSVVVNENILSKEIALEVR